MDRLVLIEPTSEYSSDIKSFREELLEENDYNSFAGCGHLRYSVSVEDWLDSIHQFETNDTCPEGYVPSDIYLAVRLLDNKVVGIIEIRHHINTPILSLWGGHIGYSVRPTERNKGYATLMLKSALKNYHGRGVEKVLITCNVNNIASEKTIIANGGIFENKVLVDGEYIKRYWIKINKI